jgi:exonuclease SbcC
MQILSVALQNFKTHHDKVIEFQPGINAISGENGAGKTSILEAIAWVLFNYQGDYAKEDLIRNGSGNAQVIVQFTSNYDGRTYEVQRCTQRGYTLFDPQLNERLPYSRIKDEVLPWLKQHIGVAKSTNLPQLFARTVGVPQGTFTADFLQSTEQRKAVFDAILKVEDYKLAHRQMNSLRRYAEDQVEALKGQIQQYDESLTQWEEVQQRRQTLAQDLQKQQQQLGQRQKTFNQLTVQRQTYQQQQQQIQTLKGQQQNLTHQINHKQDLLSRLEQSLQQSQQAISLCKKHQPAYEGYQTAEQALQSFNQQLRQRQVLQEQYRTLQTSREQQNTKLAQLRTQLDSMVKTEQELGDLVPQIEQQVDLETQVVDLRHQLDQLQQRQLEEQNLQQQLQHLQQQAASLAESCQHLETLQAAVAEIEVLEEGRDRTQQQLSRLHAARQFEGELRQLVQQSQTQHHHSQAQMEMLLKELADLAASLSTQAQGIIPKIRAAITENQGLTTRLLTGMEDILQDLSTQTDEVKLQETLSRLQQDIAQRYRWRGELEQLDSLRDQLLKNQHQQTQLQNQLEEIAKVLAQRPTVEAALEKLLQHIKELGYPREKSEILTRTLTGKPHLEETYHNLLASQTKQDQDLARLTIELDAFKGLDQAMADLQQRRAEYQSGYNLYLQHQQTAAQHPQLQQDFETHQQERQVLGQKLQSLETDLKEVESSFDEVAATQLEQDYQALRSEIDQISGRLPEMQQRLQDLSQQVKGLEAIAEKRKTTQKQLKKKEKAKRFVQFARRVYKEAGPRITEQYARAISYQADRLFRDLMGRPNVALEWTRDYEIVVQEGANQRRFVNLSGGEQMCAALAVRLALLKVLADIDIAFFDEPTTNMDRSRRASLAEAIGRIRAFQQLFVISHDDTFETVTENVIFLERSPS